MRSWLQSAENIKTTTGEIPRKVELITYDERWSELELSIAHLDEGGNNNNYALEFELFNRGGSVLSSNIKNDDSESMVRMLSPQENQSEKNTVYVLEKLKIKIFNLFRQIMSNLILPFHPYGIYKPEKLKMFGIPADQRLTSRQIVELYSIMAEIDEKVKYIYCLKNKKFIYFLEMNINQKNFLVAKMTMNNLLG